MITVLAAVNRKRAASLCCRLRLSARRLASLRRAIEARSSGFAGEGIANAACARHAALFPSDAAAIAAVGLTKDYGSYRAVDGVTLTVPRGATVGLLGGNGAGKTTTLAMIMGLMLPDAGQVRVLGYDMATQSHKVLHRMNFGSPYVGMPARLSVRQNLRVFGRLYGVPDLTRRIAVLAEEFALDGFLDCTTGRLSAGQKTRAALAKALLNEPDVLLLDEPTAALDPDHADWVRRRLEAYRDRNGMTILMASHNMPEVERLCDFVVILSHGRVVAIETPGALIRRHGRDSLDEVYLDITRSAEPHRRAVVSQFLRAERVSVSSMLSPKGIT